MSSRFKSRHRGFNAIQRRRARRRKLLLKIRSAARWVLFRGIFIAIGIGGLAFGITAGKDKLPELNPLRWNKLKTVEVSGTKRLSLDDLLQAGGLDTGMLMSEIYVDSVESALSELAWVTSVRVQKKFPSSIEIQVQESEAVMSALEAGRWVVYSAEGRELPFSTWSAYTYPVVETTSREERILCATFLHEMREKDFDLYKKVSQIGVEEHGISVYFSNLRFKTLFPIESADRSSQTFEEFRRMAGGFVKEMQNAEVLDLRFPGFAYVREKKISGKRKQNG